MEPEEDKLASYLKEMEDAPGTAGLGKDGKFYVYKDGSGNPTIGFGHLIKKGEDFSKGISQAERNKLLAQDIEDKRNELSYAYPEFKGLAKNKQDTIIAHTYQVGVNSFPKFKKAMMTGDMETARKEAPVKVKDKKGNLVPDERRNKAYSDTWLNN